MLEQPFPATVSEWNWGTVESLMERGFPENTYLEYKRHILHESTNGEKSKEGFRQGLEREITAFANGHGGMVLFGVSDEIEAVTIARPAHEPARTISQLVNQTTPAVETTAQFIPHPSAPERGVLAVRVQEATRKPVATSEAAYYVRVNDSKHPMNRELLTSLFVEADRRQQAVQQLELEFSRFFDIYDSHFEDPTLVESTPGFDLIDGTAIRETLRENSHLFTDEDHQAVILEILECLREIEQQERHYGRVVDGVAELYHEDIGKFNFDEQQKLAENAGRLYRAICRLVELSQLSPSTPNN